jgi:hypothetical protein
VTATIHGWPCLATPLPLSQAYGVARRGQLWIVARGGTAYDVANGGLWPARDHGRVSHYSLLAAANNEANGVACRGQRRIMAITAYDVANGRVGHDSPPPARPSMPYEANCGLWPSRPMARPMAASAMIHLRRLAISDPGCHTMQFWPSRQTTRAITWPDVANSGSSPSWRMARPTADPGRRDRGSKGRYVFLTA